MRAPAPLALFLAALGLGCSSAAPAASADASTTTGSPGDPCDPSAAQPCLPSGDPCVSNACDPVQRLCVEADADGGPLCAASGAPCTTSVDCVTGLVCGFPAPPAGSDATACVAPGQCIDPALACESDAASCGTQAPACGCNGEPDPFVVPGFAASPVASLTPCPDGGPVIEAGSFMEAGSSDASDER